MAITTNQILLFDVEAVEGTAETLDGTNVILTEGGITVVDYDGDRTTRETDGATYKTFAEQNNIPHSTWSFNVPMAGTGNYTDGTEVPAYSGLLQACGFTGAAGTGDYVFTFSQSASKTVTLKRHLGNKIVQATAGARGTVTFDFTAGQLQFSDFKGAYTRPAAGAFPGTITYPDQASPVAFNKSTITTMTIDSFAPCTSGFVVSMNTPVSYLSQANCGGSRHGPTTGVTGQATIEAPDPATKNFFEDVESGSGIVEVPVHIVRGTVNGNIVKMDSTGVQISNITESNTDGVVTYTLDLRFITLPTFTTA